MKKIVVLSGSVLIFIILSVISFTFDKNSNLSSGESIRTSSNESSTQHKESSGGNDQQSANVVENSSTVSSTQNGFAENIIQDIKVEYNDNTAHVTWNIPESMDIQDLKLVRTPSYVEGLAATYNVINSKGSFWDKNVKPGVRYYYQLRGKSGRLDLNSDFAVVEIPGSMQLSINENTFVINGKRLKYSALDSVKPFEINGKIMIPAKTVVDSIGGYVNWVNSPNGKTLTDVLIKYKKYEIEMFAGKREIVVNRNKRSIDYSPVVRDTVFYISLDMLNEFFDCRVHLEENTIIVEKVIDSITYTNKGNITEKEIQVTAGEEFEISLDDENQDGKSWFNNIVPNEGIVLKEKRFREKDSRISLYSLRFGVVKGGDYSLTFRLFNPKIGENINDKVVTYKIKAK